MKTNKLKAFAPKCRKDLIQQVGVKLDYVLTAKTPDLAAQEELLNALRKALQKEGREALIERVAYTWFNRFAAFRYLDVHNWHPFKARLVSPLNAGDILPELLQRVSKGDVPEELRPFISMQRIGQLLDGHVQSTNPQAEVQRHLVIGASRYYTDLLPFLFRELDAFSELLVPDDLLTEHSVVHGFVTEISEEDCAEVEVLGWLYQFYIAEKKDLVFEGLKKNKKITLDNIPAATQLFTPHWIVRYLVENSLGRLWMLNRPNSKLIEQMEYYIKPVESGECGVDSGECESGAGFQPAISAPEAGRMPAPPSIAQESGAGFQPAIPGLEAGKMPAPPSFLKISSPEEIKICDPACGSGHMLTYAFDLLYAIYEEEGYAPSDIPEKILTHNLFGIEIDRRAGELAAFALTMKARAKQRRFFGRKNSVGQLVQPNICVLENVHFEEGELEGVGSGEWLVDSGAGEVGSGWWGVDSGKKEALSHDLHLFEESDNFGSLLRPQLPLEDIRALQKTIYSKLSTSNSLFDILTYQKVLRVLTQADYLSQKYHIVVANPPYMSRGGMNARLKAWVEDQFSKSKLDLMTCFMERALSLTTDGAHMGMINIPSWMFLSSFEELRRDLLQSTTVTSLLHLGRGVFGSDFGTVAFCIQAHDPKLDYRGIYRRLFEAHVEVRSPDDIEQLFLDFSYNRYAANQLDFLKLPLATFAYWTSAVFRDAFERGHPLSTFASIGKGLDTGDNDRFLKFWHETSRASRRWFPCQKGGPYRKWYGNNDYVIDWGDNGAVLKAFPKSNLRNSRFYLREGGTWTRVSSGSTAFRYFPEGHIFESTGPCLFTEASQLPTFLGFLNSRITLEFLKVLAPMLDFQSGHISSLPFLQELLGNVSLERSSNDAILLARSDWDSYETSWDFTSLPLLNPDYRQPTLKASYQKLRAHWREMTLEMQRLEEENNRIFIDAYGLQDELTPEVPLNEITLTCNPHYRYNKGKSEAELEALLLADTMRELVSYAVGCMMGRYSLDKPGLILADAGDTLDKYFEWIVGSGEWIVESGKFGDKEENYEGTKLSPTDRVAEGHGNGLAGLSSDKGFSEGGDLWSQQPDSASCGIDPIEYRGRPSEKVDSRISAILKHCPRFKSRSGNPNPDCPAIGLCNRLHRSGDTVAFRGGCQTALCSDSQPQINPHHPLPTPHHPLTTTHCPLSTIHYLPDEDAILPITEDEWFADDAAARVREFLKVTFGTEHLERNLAFLEEALGKDLRKYFTANAGGFYADHVQTYKKRPIYWMFESPKKHFRALIYLHRYNKDTVNKLLNGYLREFRHKLAHRREDLEQSIADGTASAADRKILQKTLEAIKDVEDYERNILLPLAQRRLEIDLDDGVKQNYPKFGAALAKIVGL